MGLIVLILLVILLIGALLTWRYSREWGYAPTGILGGCCSSVSCCC